MIYADPPCIDIDVLDEVLAKLSKQSILSETSVFASKLWARRELFMGYTLPGVYRDAIAPSKSLFAHIPLRG